MIDDNLKTFFYWINERHRIYLKRQRGESWPWTNDKILQLYRFCNVFRELDTETIWIRENIREPFKDHEDLFFNLMMARLFNWHGTLEKLGFVDTWDDITKREFIEILRDMQRMGEKIFTGAYMITGTHGPNRGKGIPKIEQVIFYVLDPIWQRRKELEPKPIDTLQSAFERIVNGNVPGFARFLSYEVITDLRWTRYLRGAQDIMTWASAGPGAKRGINRLYGRDINERIPEDFALEVMQYLLDVSVDWLYEYMPEPEMRDIEHSLCEYDKYCRVMEGGRMRSTYTPPHLRS